RAHSAVPSAHAIKSPTRPVILPAGKSMVLMTARASAVTDSGISEAVPSRTWIDDHRIENRTVDSTSVGGREADVSRNRSAATITAGWGGPLPRRGGGRRFRAPRGRRRGGGGASPRPRAAPAG